MEGTGHGRRVATLDDLAGCDFASVRETADIMRADPRTIRRRIADGLIPAIRIGSDWRIPTRWIREVAQAGVAA